MDVLSKTSVTTVTKVAKMADFRQKCAKKALIDLSFPLAGTKFPVGEQRLLEEPWAFSIFMHKIK